MPNCGCENNTFEIVDNTENCECKQLANQIQCKAKEIIDLAERLKCTCDRPIAVKLDYELTRPKCNCNKCCN